MNEFIYEGERPFKNIDQKVYWVILDLRESPKL